MIQTYLSQASLASLLGLVVSALPVIAGIWYAIRPEERRLALMRPLSLAAIFASVASLLLGLVNALHHAGTLDATGAANTPLVTLLAESLIPGFIGFACLTAAWLCVAVALRKAP